MRRRMFVWFFILALLVRLGIAAKFGMFHWLERSEMEVIALNLVQFGNYGLYGGPTAHSTPVFPLYLAGIFSVLGGGVAAQAAIATLACAVSALRCALVPLFALDAGFHRGIAVIAGCFSALYIGSLETEVSGKLDGPFVAIAMLALIWGAMRIWRGGSWQTRTPWWFFALCGFSALLNPSLLPVMGGLFLAGAVACPAGACKRYLRQTALAVAGILLFLLPWSIRNYVSLGAPILTRSNFGLEFWVSNGPGRTFDLPGNGVFHPSGHPAETAKVAELGEVSYNRMRLAEAMAWVRANPGQYLRFTAERIAAWWFPPHPSILLAPKLILTLLAFAGLWRMFRLQPLAAWLFLITWLTFPDVHYLIQWIGRYRTPMDWQILFSASVAVFAAWQSTARFRSGAKRDVPTVA